MGLRDRSAAAPTTQQFGAQGAAATPKPAEAAAAPQQEAPPPAAATARPSVIPTETAHQADPGPADDSWAQEEAEDGVLLDEPPVAGASMGIQQGQRLEDTTEGEFDATPTPAAAPPVVREERMPSTQVATGGFLHTQQQLEDQGYATDVSFGTFPNLVLNNLGQFECKDWESGPMKKLTALHVIVVQVKRKWLYREKKEKGARVRYSYDLIPYPKNPDAADAQGNPIKAFVQMLEGEGAVWESKMYYEALAVVVGSEGEGAEGHEGEMVLISMSPTSKAKWSGYTIQTKMLKRCLPHEVVTRVSCGPSMTVQNQNFFPLAFKALRRANLEEFANAAGFEVTADAE